MSFSSAIQIMAEEISPFIGLRIPQLSYAYVLKEK